MNDWLPVMASIVAAVGSVAAAVVAARSAGRTRDAQLQAEHALELEKRLAASKAEVYEPMVELFRGMLDAAKNPKQQTNERKLIETLSKFTAWTQVYGSDDVLREFHKLMQAAFHDAPAEVFMRLYAQFVLAVRRDLGDPRTEVTLTELLGMRISDVYEKMASMLDLDERAFFAQQSWTPPWPGSYYGGASTR